MRLRAVYKLRFRDICEIVELAADKIFIYVIFFELILYSVVECADSVGIPALYRPVIRFEQLVVISECVPVASVDPPLPS